MLFKYLHNRDLKKTLVGLNRISHNISQLDATAVGNWLLNIVYVVGPSMSFRGL